MRSLHVLFLALLFHSSFSQQREIDSIENRIRNASSPSEVVYEKAMLVPKYFVAGNMERSITLLNEASTQATTGVSGKALGALYNTRGILHFYQGQIDSALAHFILAVDHRKKGEDLLGAIKTTGNIGNIYLIKRNYEKAQKYYEDALKMEAELGYEEGEHTSLNNLAAIYTDMKLPRKAIHYFRKAIAIGIKKNSYSYLSVSYDGLSSIYRGMGKTDSAFFYAGKALKLAEELGDQMGVAYALMNKALVYHFRKQYDTALTILHTSLQYAYQAQDSRLLLGIYGNIVSCFILSDRQDSAIVYMERYLFPLQSQLQLKGSNPDIVRLEAEYHKRRGNYEKAFEAMNLYAQLADSAYQGQVEAKVAEFQEKYESDKKEKENQVLQAEVEQQKTTQRYLLIILGIAILSILGGLFAYNKIRKANTTIREQKVLVEEKQKEIIDSINYAKRIQYALLASEQLLKKHLPQNFVFFLPKSVVSGDFYWANPADGGFMLLAGDCTGHGVPGAFMSLLNITKVSQVISEQNVTRPDLVLNKVRDEIIRALNPEGSDEESKDGMDAVLCKFRLGEFKLEYAAANNSFYIIRNKKVLTCTADKMPVGKGHDDSVPFTYNEITLEKNDMIYLFTDGFADQFGGPLGKKFKYKQLEQLLISICEENMDTQKGLLATAFNKWKGSLEQVDDVCVIGVRV